MSNAGAFQCCKRSEELLSVMLCPQCSGRTHRSHTDSLSEKLFRNLTSLRLYRCRECGWRGWLRNPKPSRKRHVARTIIGLLVTLLITTLLALYLVEKLNAPVSDQDSQQQAP